MVTMAMPVQKTVMVRAILNTFTLPRRHMLTTCTANNVSYSFFQVHTISLPLERRSTKRARTAPSKNQRNARTGLSKRVRGRLSELPTMPLDILYEVRGASQRAKSANPTVSLPRFSDTFCHQTCSRLVALTKTSVTFSCLAALYSCGKRLIS
jgi:hypothetical protein